MPFESGSVGFRMFYLTGSLPDDHVQRFANHAPAPLTTLSKDPIHGWVTGRHLLDRDINDQTASVAGYLRLTLMKAEKKIPEALLRAECKMDELAHLAASGKLSLKRSEKIEIRKAIIERLLPQMPPTLTGIPMVCDQRDGLIYAGALSEKQLDAFVLSMQQTVGMSPIAATPQTAAMRRKQANFRDLRPTSFSPELEDELAGDSLGQDFLTWLWFFSEARGGIFHVGGREFGVGLDGPITMMLEGSGAHETVLRNGSPLVSAEAKTALLSGKKLRKAKLMLACGNDAWTVTLDADEFIFRGLKLPKGDELEPVSKFQERMLAIETFRDAFLDLYDRFIDERTDPSTWAKTRNDVRKWVANRPTS